MELGSFEEVGMGCFPCFDSRDGEQLVADNGKDDRREEQPMVAPRIDRLPSGQFESFELLKRLI